MLPYHYQLPEKTIKFIETLMDFNKLELDITYTLKGKDVKSHNAKFYLVELSIEQAYLKIKKNKVF